MSVQGTSRKEQIERRRLATIERHRETSRQCAIQVEELARPLTINVMAKLIGRLPEYTRHSLNHPSNIWLFPVHEADGKTRFYRTKQPIDGYAKDWSKDPLWRPWVAPGDKHPAPRLGM